MNILSKDENFFLLTRRPYSTKSMTFTNKKTVSEIAKLIKSQLVEVFLNAALENVNKLQMFPVKPIINEIK